MGSAVRKVRGGKLLRVKVEEYGTAITNLTITGDFFIYPEEGLGLLEESLVGAKLDEGIESLSVRIAAILMERSITPLGFAPADLAEVILEARG